MEASSAVSCLVRFAKQNRPWTNNKYIDFLFKNVFKFEYKKHLFVHKINKFIPETAISQQKCVNECRPNLGQCSVAG